VGAGCAFAVTTDHPPCVEMPSNSNCPAAGTRPDALQEPGRADLPVGASKSEITVQIGAKPGGSIGRRIFDVHPAHHRPEGGIGCALFARRLLWLVTLFPATSLWAQLPAFPGAEGFGRFATGGRGGSVYHVTHLNDSGPGSFRDAVSVSGRTVVFDVAGIIDYQPPRYAPKPNITIAGQTAPGDGVTLYGNGLSFSGSHNCIARFLRVRQGVNGDSGTDAVGIANGHDMIFDHLSVSWGRDETFSVNGDITNITIQSTIIAQGLQTHSAGGLIQTPGGVSILRSLYIDNDTRNPKVKFVNEFVNNVVCNWETIGYNMGGDSAGDSYVNAFNNYFIRGPYSSSTAFGGGNANFHIYATNNWFDSNRNGALDGAELPLASYGDMDWQSTPFAYPISNAPPPLTALKLVISDAGTSQHRDAVDERLMTEVLSWGTMGQTISSEYASPMNGPGALRAGTAPLDTDQDGLPDYWEAALGMSTNSANNNDPSPTGSGYTRLEDYLNWLAEPHGAATTNTPVAVDLRMLTRGFTNSSPVYSVSNPTNGSVTLAGGCIARFAPTTGFIGPASFQFAVTDAGGSALTRTMNLCFTPLTQSYSPIWHGDDASNNWNVLGDNNWYDGQSLLYQFRNGDAVTFDSTGSTSPALNLIGSLQPASVTVNAAQPFTFSGGGSLDGSMGLIKTNTGTLTLNTTNGYTGATTIGQGTVLVNGTLDLSPVTVLNGGAAGGSGWLGNGVTVQSGGAVIVGNGIGTPGTLTITNALTQSGNTTIYFDLSDDPTGTVKTNDQINIIGNLNLSGVNIIRMTLLDGPPGDGVYTLFTYTGTLSGGLANLAVVGAHGALTNPPGAIGLIVSSSRAPASLQWVGDGANNVWDLGTNANWLNDGVPDRFYFLDDVTFDDAGSTNPAVRLSGPLNPKSVTVDASVDYAFSGSGKISGTTGLTKTNSGRLTLSTTNDYTGPTVIGGGALSVSLLANGGGASGIGAGANSPSNLVFYDGALIYSGANVAIDRGATLHGAGILDIVSSGATLTHNGVLTGAGTFVKAGAGTLTLITNNSFSGGVTLSNGTVYLSTTFARDGGLGSGTVTFKGGTLRLYGEGGSTGTDWGTFNRPLSVPVGQVGTVLAPPRYTMGSALTGGGTLNLRVHYVRGALSGNWSAFTGVINATAKTLTGDSNEFRVATSLGFPGATVILGTNVVMTRNGGSATINLGALGGTPGSWVGPGNSSSGGTTYSVGWNDADATFAGTIKNDGTTTFIKSGAGTWTLTGANSWSGGTTLNGGLILANNSSGSALGTGAVTVNPGGSLGGAGFVGAAVTISANGTLSPGSNGIGTLTINSSLALNNSAVLQFELGAPGASDKVAVNGALTLGGVLNVTNLAGFGAGTYTLFTYTGALSGALPTIGSKPAGYSGAVDTNTTGQVRLVVQVQTPPVFGSVILTNGVMAFSGSGGPTNVLYCVLSATNLALPLNNWRRFATNLFDPAGNFSFTDILNPAAAQTFYLVQLP
jgi:autotransporter-associated beta strand protein